MTRRLDRGFVWLLGAGPGSADLLTLRAARLLAIADVVAYDELVSAEVLALARPDAELVPVGRRAAFHRHDGRIHPLVVARALEGKNVARLKGGDPSVFGRVGEEADELAAAGIPFEIVPGVSAALAAAASARVPLTHRGVSSHVTLATATREDGAPASGLPTTGTLVLYMSLGKLEATLASLVASGRAAETPAMVVSRASLADERIVTGTLATLAARVRAAALPTPALLVVGDVVTRALLATQPLHDHSEEAESAGRAAGSPGHLVGSAGAA